MPAIMSHRVRQRINSAWCVARPSTDKAEGKSLSLAGGEELVAAAAFAIEKHRELMRHAIPTVDQPSRRRLVRSTPPVSKRKNGARGTSPHAQLRRYAAA